MHFKCSVVKGQEPAVSSCCPFRIEINFWELKTYVFHLAFLMLLNNSYFSLQVLEADRSDHETVNYSLETLVNVTSPEEYPEETGKKLLHVIKSFIYFTFIYIKVELKLVTSIVL